MLLAEERHIQYLLSESSVSGRCSCSLCRRTWRYMSGRNGGGGALLGRGEAMLRDQMLLAKHRETVSLSRCAHEGHSSHETPGVKVRFGLSFGHFELLLRQFCFQLLGPLWVGLGYNCFDRDFCSRFDCVNTLLNQRFICLEYLQTQGYQHFN